MRSAVAQDGSFIPYKYELKNKSFVIKKIMCYSCTNVPLHLLAIDEKRKRGHQDACKYNKKERINTYCIKDNKSFAHIYISTERKNVFIKHYIVAFVKRKDLKNYNDLVNILLKTVEWLKIKDDRPLFYIYYYDCYGDNLAAEVSIPYVRTQIINGLKRGLFYPKKLYCNNNTSICRTESIRKDATMFVISSKSPTDPYQFEVS